MCGVRPDWQCSVKREYFLGLDRRAHIVLTLATRAVMDALVDKLSSTRSRGTRQSSRASHSACSHMQVRIGRSPLSFQATFVLVSEVR